jgi:hypothetical protein
MTAQVAELLRLENEPNIPHLKQKRQVLRPNSSLTIEDVGLEGEVDKADLAQE